MPVEIRRMPIRSKEIELVGEWAGWKFTGRTNIPMQALADLMTGQYNLIIAGLTEVVLGWNFVDEKGESLPNPAGIHTKVYPAPLDENGQPVPQSYEEVEGKRKKELYRLIGRIPLDLAIEMASALVSAANDVPPKS
jgi:hypothetical protein